MTEKDKNLIKEIIKSKKNCVFVSPHLDDAILSCGGLIYFLSSQTEVKVINVFTKVSNSKASYSIKKFVRKCGYNDAKKLFQDRIVEDEKVLGRINIKPINLGFTDALWRTKRFQKGFRKILAKYIPELRFIYPSGLHLLSGKISKFDTGIVEKVSRAIFGSVDVSDSILFVPLAIGNHVDHVIVRKACETLGGQIIFWSDFPYSSTNSGKRMIVKSEGLRRFKFDKYQEERLRLIKGYKTQVKALFKDDSINLTPERYFLNSNFDKSK